MSVTTSIPMASPPADLPPDQTLPLRVRGFAEMYGQAGGTGLLAPRDLPAMHAAKQEKRCGLPIDRVRWPADEKARI
jgi:hypothetical protein